jgi:beta-lactamase class A
VNDVAIVFSEKPYILVVYTNELPGLAEKQPHEKIAGLSKLIYEAQQAK